MPPPSPGGEERRKRLSLNEHRAQDRGRPLTSGAEARPLPVGGNRRRGLAKCPNVPGEATDSQRAPKARASQSARSTEWPRYSADLSLRQHAGVERVVSINIPLSPTPNSKKQAERRRDYGAATVCVRRGASRRFPEIARGRAVGHVTRTTEAPPGACPPRATVTWCSHVARGAPK